MMRPSMKSGRMWVGTALAVVAFAPAVHAQPSPSPTPRLLIESIAVEGTTRESVKRIVIAESRLTGGREYTEAEIRDAVRRVKRIPFVLDARPSLRRGTSPGQYLLVFEIKEDAGLVLSAALSHIDGRVTNWTTGHAGIAGTRFLGAGTRVFADVRQHGVWSDFGALRSGTRTPRPFHGSGTLTAGFEQYNLLRDASRLRVDLSSRLDDSKNRNLVRHRSSASLLLPLGRNQSVTLETQAFLHGGVSGQVGATWVYDTTDDPFAALEGTRLSAQADIGAFRFRRGPSGLRDHWSWHLGEARLVGSRTIPIHRSLAFEPSLEAVQCRFDEMVVRRPRTGWNFDFPCDVQARTTLRYVRVGTRNSYRGLVEAGLEAEPFDTPRRRYIDWSAHVGVALRSRFAVVRLGFRHAFRRIEW